MTMDLHNIADGIKNLMSKLSELLQESLVSDSSTTLSEALVETITFGHQLSIEANTIIKKAVKRESDLVSCLNQMKSVLQLQKTQITKFNSRATWTVGTNTEAVPVTCATCETSTVLIAALRQEMLTARCDVEVLQRQLKQSKCLLQAQQVWIADLECARRPSNERTSSSSDSDRERDSEPLQPPQDWGTLFRDNAPTTAPSSTNKAPDRHMGAASAPVPSRPPLAPASRYHSGHYDDDGGTDDEQQHQQQQYAEEDEVHTSNEHGDEYGGEYGDRFGGRLTHSDADVAERQEGDAEWNEGQEEVEFSEEEEEQEQEEIEGEGRTHEEQERGAKYPEYEVEDLPPRHPERIWVQSDRHGDGAVVGKHHAHGLIHARKIEIKRSTPAHLYVSQAQDAYSTHRQHDTVDIYDDDGDDACDVDSSRTLSTGDVSHTVSNTSSNSSGSYSSGGSGSTGSNHNDVSAESMEYNNRHSFGGNQYVHDTYYEDGGDCPERPALPLTGASRDNASASAGNTSGWGEYDGNMDDSFTLIQNFYKAGKLA